MSFVAAQDTPDREVTRIAGQLRQVAAAKDREIQALQAEERFLNSYNELNTNDKLDIVCVDAAPIGSRIVRRTCLPQYRWDERSNESASFLRNVGAVAPTTEITVMPTDTELLENLQTLARENPELLDSLMDFQDKLATLNAAQQSGSDEE